MGEKHGFGLSVVTAVGDVQIKLGNLWLQKRIKKKLAEASLISIHVIETTEAHYVTAVSLFGSKMLDLLKY